MFFNAPSFWSTPPLWILKLFLKPISVIYNFFLQRNCKKPYAHSMQDMLIVAVGGLTVGGSGKTVVAAHLCKTLIASGFKPAILSRGYGRKNKHLLIVDSLQHSYSDVGDEPLLLSKFTTVIVGKNRYESALIAKRLGYDALILDDGFMQKCLKPDINILVIDGLQGVGNGELFPLGPNRFIIDTIKNKIDAVIAINHTKKINYVLSRIPSQKQAMATMKAKYPVMHQHNIVAFCAIGYPKKFFIQLGNDGFNIVYSKHFPDHYPFSEKDIKALIDIANNNHATLITTEKDFVRVPTHLQKYVQFVEIKLSIS